MNATSCNVVRRSRSARKEEEHLVATVTPELSKNLINGQWVESTSSQTMPSMNPATGEVLGHVPKSESADVVAAIEAA